MNRESRIETALRHALRPVIIKSEELRIVQGSVYAPGQVDSQGDVMDADAIREMAWNFLLKGRTDKIDVQHSKTESGCKVVESCIIRGDKDPDGYVNGEWVLTVKVLDDTIWDACKRGELNGFSFMGKGEEETRTEDVVQAVAIKGDSEDSTGGPFPPHRHPLNAKLDDEGRLIPTRTGETLGHSHSYKKTSATEIEFDHAHRVILE